MKPLLIIDGDNLAHRAYHSTPKTVKSERGEPINAIVGFFGMLTRIWQAGSYRAIFVAWDTLGVDTYRSELWPPYQGGRIFDSEIREQLGRLPLICKSFEFGVGKQSGMEADDLMASAACKEVSLGGRAVLYTSDKDSYQLICEQVKVLSPKRGGAEPELIDERGVVEKMGVLPEQIADFKALCGDASDKIPGVRGIGPKAAASLLLKHGTLDNVAHNLNEKDAKLALMFREVVRMNCDVPVELPDGAPNWMNGAEELRRIGAASLADRIAKLSQ